jgi:hypothetical protein
MMANMLKTWRGAILAPIPCAGCPEGHAEQDWQSNLTGQVFGFCAHCAASRSIAETLEASGRGPSEPPKTGSSR